MAYFESWFKVDLALPLKKRIIETELVNDDKQGNLIGVELYKNNTPVTPTGTATGYALLADGTSQSFSGSISSNRISVVLPEEAYSVVGPVTILIRLAESGRKTTVLVAQGLVRARWQTPGSGGTVDPTFDPSDEELSELYSRVEALESAQSQTNIVTSGLDARTGNLETGISDLATTTSQLDTTVTSLSSNLLNNYLTSAQTSEAISEHVESIRIGSRNYLKNSSANMIIRNAEPSTGFPPGNMQFDISELGDLYYEEDTNNDFDFELDGGNLYNTQQPDGYDHSLELDEETGELYLIADPDGSYYTEDERFFTFWEYPASTTVAVNGKHNGQNAIEFSAPSSESGVVTSLTNNSLYDTITVESGDDITISLWYNLTQAQKEAWSGVGGSASFQIVAVNNAEIRTETIGTINQYSLVGWRKLTKTYKIGTDFYGIMPTTNFYFAVVLTGAGSIQFGQVMIEKSTKASDWAPAPEDGDEVDKNSWVETKQIASGVLTEVTKVNSDLSTNYSTTLQTADMISSAVTTLENGIASNYSTQTQTASLINAAVTAINADLTSNYSTRTQTASAIQDQVTAINTNLQNNYTTKTQTATDIATAVASVNNNLQTNYSTIVQTSAAIGSAVASINNNLSTNYSTITQTSTAIDFSVGRVENTLQNGSRNLIHNTAYPSKVSAKYLPNINGYVDYGRYITNAGTVTPVEHGMKITATSAVNVFSYLGTNTVANGGLYGLKTGEYYTWSFITDFKMYSGLTSSSSDTYQVLATFYYATSASASGWTDGEHVVIQEYDSTNFGNTFTGKKVVLTFRIPEEATRICLRVGGSGTNNSYFAAGDFIALKYLKLEEGECPTAWTAAPEDEVRVLKNASMELTEDKLDVSFDDVTVMEITPTAANFNVKTMSVKGSIVGNVVNTQGTATYTVSSGNAVIKELQTWIDSLGKYLTGTVTINITSTLEGTIYLRGFKAGNNDGRVNINFTGDGFLYGGIYIYDCDRVAITGKGMGTTMHDIESTSQQCCVSCYRTKYLTCTDLFTNASESSYSSTKHNYRMDGGVHFHFENCYAAGGHYGWYITNGSIGDLYNCKGGSSGSDYACSTATVRALYGSVVHVAGAATNGTKPYGSIGAANYSATVNVSSSVTATEAVVNGDALPVVANYSTVTVTPKSSASGTYGGTFISTSSSATNTSAANMVAYSSSYNGKIRTGNNNGGYNYGIWYFGSGSSNKITSVPNLSSVTYATIQIIRQKQQGGNENNKFNLYYYKTGIDNAKSSGETPGGYFATNGTANLIAENLECDLGGAVCVNLTGTALAQLKAGNIGGFGVGGSNWMQFEPQGCELTLIW